MQVLYIDIETTGLDKDEHKITVIGTVIKTVTYVQNTPVYTDVREHCYNVCIAEEAGGTTLCDMRGEIYNLLDTSDIIVAFNGINFDIPFLFKWMERESESQKFDRKILDYCRLNQIILKQRVKLSVMCVNNKIQDEKYATGLDAIKWAEEKNWKELEHYCMQDVFVMSKLTEKSVVEGLVLIRPAKNEKSINAIDKYKEVVIVFNQRWTPCIPLPEWWTSYSDSKNMVSVYDIELNNYKISF